MVTNGEIVTKIFNRHLDSMKARSLRWTLKGNSKWGDRRIEKFIKYFSLPIDTMEVIALLDTTVFKTGKEGYLFTTSGVFVKEVINKLYYLEFDKIERAEVQEERDEYYNLNTSVRVHFKDGTSKKLLDYYINKYSFVDYINDAIAPENFRGSAFGE